MPAGQRRILIIDDSELVREAAAVALELGGWVVETVPDGELGVQTARDQQPDGVLLDVVMPGLDGPEVLQRLRQDPRTAELPVAFLTARADDPNVRAALLAEGAAAVIGKPFEMATLADVVCEAFGWTP